MIYHIKRYIEMRLNCEVKIENNHITSEYDPKAEVTEDNDDDDDDNDDDDDDNNDDDDDDDDKTRFVFFYRSGVSPGTRLRANYSKLIR
ncbi:hypothetical protein V1477_008210 [Vespula maculifrons]|uniref:Uncharacterized protein n=1 Tax=Vespula maculifrons TaxID=7453 RepID=A0ABD2CCD3_VESMC